MQTASHLADALIDALIQDVRFALRQLRRSPWFALTALLTLMLGIGATAALTGVLRATLLSPLPYARPGDLVEIEDRNLKGFADKGLMAVPRTDDLANFEVNGRKLFRDSGFYYFEDAPLARAGGEPVRTPTAAVSGTFFSTLGAAPLLGRTLGPADNVPNGPERVVLSHALWQSRFAGDPGVVGSTVRLDKAQATVVGVMPAGFSLPGGTQMWHPGRVFASSFAGYRGDGSRFVSVVARLNDGFTEANVPAALDTLAERLAHAHPDTDAGWGFRVTGLRAFLFGEYRPALHLLAAAVGLVLLVAAVNLAGLTLARNARRAPEFATRAALGVSRTRLVCQLATETLLLVGIGAVAGVVLAWGLLHDLAHRLPAALTRVAQPRLDPATLGMALAAALAVGLATALAPALQATAGYGEALLARLGSRGHTGKRRFGAAFTAAQVGLALVLLTLASAVLTSLYRVLTAPLGFERAGRLTFSIDMPWNSSPARAHRLYTRAAEALAALPGVEAVGAESALPLSGYTFRKTFDIVGQPPTAQHDAVVAEGRTVSLGYLPTMHIPLVAGRALAAVDELATTSENGAPVPVLVNRAFAHRYAAGGSETAVLGMRLLAPPTPNATPAPLEIVGVVGDTRGTGGSLSKAPAPELYSLEDGGWPHMEFVVRTGLGAQTLMPSVRRAVAALDPAASAGDAETFDTAIDRTLRQPRLTAGLLGGFAVLTLVLVVIGVYGLVAFEVTERTRELGLRMALGATRGGVLALVLGRSIRMLAAGVAGGVAASLLAGRLLGAALPSAAVVSPLHLGAAALVLGAAVVLSSLVPARRAARLDPMAALRTE